jgi:putative nucleotidyltransferase with HDIG domain
LFHREDSRETLRVRYNRRVTAHPLDRRLVAALPPDSVYAVGGRVRDELRARLDGRDGVAPKDLDYVVTGLTLAELVERLRTVGRVDVVGASFAVVKLTAPEGSADVALPRRERSTGSGHRDFAVQSGPEVRLEDDLGRRDFRMNMIARRLSDGAIVDPFGGVADIAARRIDIVAPAAFDEDPLRMLRAAQFAARFAFAPTEATLVAMRAAAPLVATVSAERLGDELAKLIGLAPQPSIGLEILRTTGVLALVWPEILEGVGVDQNEWHAYDVYRHNLETLDATSPGDLSLRLAALLHDVGKPRTKDGPHFYRHEHVGADLVVAMLERARFSRETTETVAHLVRSHMYSADPELAPRTLRRFVNRIGAVHLDRLFALRHADIVGSGVPKRGVENERFEARIAEILAERPPFTVRDLAIGGDDVIALFVARGRAPAGFRGDRRVGAVLAQLFEDVLDEPERNDREHLLARAAALVDEEPPAR